jgi:hypothetical protein
MCTICHTNVESRGRELKPFPPLRSFNMTFNHAKHRKSTARPVIGRSTGGCVVNAGGDAGSYNLLSLSRAASES